MDQAARRLASALTVLTLGLVLGGGEASAQTTKQAVQKGINFLSEDVRQWSDAHGCVACHRQGAPLFAISQSKANGYDMDQGLYPTRTTGQNLKFIADFVRQDQQAAGYWSHFGSFVNSKTAYALYGMAGYDNYVSTEYSSSVVNGINWVLQRQDADGSWIDDHNHFPIDHGRVAPTSRFLVAMAQAKQRVDPSTAARYDAAIAKAVAYLKAHKDDNYSVTGMPNSFQVAWAIIGMKAAGVPDSDPVIVELQNRLLARNTSGGRGWGYTEGAAPNALNTGIVLYSLCSSGIELDGSANATKLVNAIQYLRDTQHSSGGWAVGTAHMDVDTTFALLGMSCFGEHSVGVAVVGEEQKVLDAYLSTPQSATYTFEVENKSAFNVTDTYDLRVAGGLPGWTAVLSQNVVALAAGARQSVSLTVTAPSNLLEAIRVEMTVTATSRGNTGVSASARVITFTNPPPPVTGHVTQVANLTPASGSSITVGQTYTLSAQVRDTQAGGLLVVGPGKGVMTFFVAGAAIGTDADLDSNGVYSITWSPDYSWNALGAQDFRAIYSGIDLASGTDLLSSLASAQLNVFRPADILPPTVQLDAQPAYVNGGILAVTGQVADSGSGVDAARFVVNGQPLSNLVVDATGAVSDSITLGEGLNTIVLEATDRAGNVSATQLQIVRDTQLPSLTVLSPAAGAIFGSSAISLRVDAADASPITVTVGGASYALTSSGVITAPVTLAAAGSNTFVLHAVDAAGNQSTHTVAYVLDISAPVLTTSLNEGAAFGPLPGNVLGWDVTVDEVSPSTVAFNNGTVLSLAYGGGVAQAGYALVEGQNVLSVDVTEQHQDGVNLTSSMSRTVVYDVTAPVASVAVPGSGALVRGTTDLAVVATDNLTGVGTVVFQVNGVGSIPAALVDGQWVASLDTTLLVDGSHPVTAVAVDGVGNSSTVTSSFVVDNTVPSAQLTGPAANGYYAGTITVSASASDATSGVQSITLFANGAALYTCSNATTCAVPFDTTSLPDGAFNLSAVAMDAAGNQSTLASYSVTSDNSVPEKFLTGPIMGDVVTADTMTIEVTVTDVNFQSLECSVNGVSLGVSTNPVYSATVNLLDMLDGEHSVACVATDLAGNSGSETARFQVRHWEFSMNPRTLNLKNGGGGGAATLYVEGRNVALLLPISAHDLKLVVAGGSPVPALAHPASAQVGDQDGDGIPDLTLKFDRSALLSSINGGVSAGAIDPKAPLRIRLFAGNHETGGDYVTLKK